MNKFKLAVIGFIFAFGFILAPSMIHADNLAPKKVNFGLCNARRHNAINTVRFYTKQEDRIILNQNRRVSQFEALQTKFSTAGKNTDELKSDIATLKDKINTLKCDIDSLKTTATDFQNIACDDSKWTQSATDMFNAEKKVRQDQADIEKFIRTDINPDLAALRRVVTPTVTPTLTPSPTP